MQIEIKDLDALAEAAAQLGCELVRGQKTYKWYGEFVGDSPMPTGFTRADLGKCDHAIRVKGKPGAYEIGVVKRRDGKPGYTLLWDFWNGGHGLEEAIGKDGRKLRQEYPLAVGARFAKSKGYRTVKRFTREDGSIALHATH